MKIIFVWDDGSTDGSAEFLKAQASQIRNDLKAVILRRNYGQTAAMAAGFNYALGKAIVTLDADLQNDPADIPMLLAKLEERLRFSKRLASKNVKMER